MSDSWDYVESITEALRDDLALNTWATSTYGKELELSAGINMRDLPGVTAAPYVVVAPDPEVDELYDEDRRTTTYGIRLILGVADDTTETVGAITTYIGERRIIREFAPKVLAAVRPLLAGRVLRAVKSACNFMDFPLIERAMVLHVVEPITLGVRG
ncbi:hypothetical protein [Desulfovibrio inopinatus]|uniref:hypothetical protein n=1 Tax=Desulfovibrio inopinatus TaxID=102109 RepID=UPI00041D6CAE|nr:hypothetical protein [Desulfovibrio inopinatus]